MAAEVFLSYKREDEHVAARIVSGLRAAGLQVWWDRDIPPSAAWEATIEQALTGAVAVVVCWSPAAAASENVRSEARWARERGNLIQLFVEPCSPPLFFGERQGIDLTRWSGDSSDAEFRSLVSAVIALTGSSAVPASERAATVPRPRSVAVLPFANMTGDATKDYLGEGMAEELILTLSRGGGIEVPSRTSAFAYKGRDADARRIGRELGVGAVLEGSVRAGGERIRVSAQLIDAQSGFTLWSEAYDRTFGDLFELQDELAGAIAGALKARLGGAPPRPSDPELLRLHMEAKALAARGSPSSLLRAIELHERAIARDPLFARAWGGLAGTLMVACTTGVLAPERRADARAKAEEAIRLDPLYAGPHAIRAVLDALVGRWLDADRGFRDARELDSREPRALDAMGSSLLAPAGQLGQAIDLSRQAVDLAPAVANFRLGLAALAATAGELELAIRNVEMASLLGLSDGHPSVPMLRAEIALATGRFDEAEERMVAALALLPAPPRLGEAFAAVFQAFSGRCDPAAASRNLSRIADEGPIRAMWHRNGLAGQMLTWQVRLGSLDGAYALADHLIGDWTETGSMPLGSLRQLWHHELRPFRDDPRFSGLVARLGLPSYWDRRGPPDG